MARKRNSGDNGGDNKRARNWMCAILGAKEAPNLTGATVKALLVTLERNCSMSQ